MPIKKLNGDQNFQMKTKVLCKQNRVQKLAKANKKEKVYLEVGKLSKVYRKLIKVEWIMAETRATTE